MQLPIQQHFRQPRVERDRLYEGSVLQWVTPLPDYRAVDV